MSWFWFFVALLMLVWNVFLMRTLSLSKHDVRRLRRKLLAQDMDQLPGFLLLNLRDGGEQR